MKRRFVGCIAFAFVLSLSLAAIAQPAPNAPAEPEGMVKLFNGTDLTGWDGDPKLWSVKDGVIHGETTKENPAKGNTFILCTRGELKDFELRLSVRIDPGGVGHGNSGIQYRSRHVTEAKENKWVVAGYQMELCNEPANAGFLYHERGRGSLCLVGNKTVIGADGKGTVVGSVGKRDEIGKGWKMSDWNDYIIIAKGNHVTQYINGVQTIDLVDNDEKGRCMSGIIALQIHAGNPMVVEFKDIRLKEYPAEGAAK